MNCDTDLTESLWREKALSPGIQVDISLDFSRLLFFFFFSFSRFLSTNLMASSYLSGLICLLDRRKEIQSTSR